MSVTIIGNDPMILHFKPKPVGITVGQVVKVVEVVWDRTSPTGYMGNLINLGTITKITPKRSDVVITSLVDGKVTKYTALALSYRRNLVPLKDGETVEAIKAYLNDKAAEDEKRAKAERERQEFREQIKAEERQKVVSEWWEKAGKAIWDSRVQIGKYADCDIYTIIIPHNNKTNQVQFATVGVTNRNDGYTVKIAGLSGNTYTNDDNSTRSEINGYYASGAVAKTLEDCLYTVCKQ